jgi:hypothetical protein
MAAQLHPTAPVSESTHGRRRIDPRNMLDAVLIVLLLRVALGLPGAAPVGQWLQRVLVMPWVRYDVRLYLRATSKISMANSLCGRRPGCCCLARSALFC